jgi:hypothetical protein
MTVDVMLLDIRLPKLAQFKLQSTTAGAQA